MTLNLALVTSHKPHAGHPQEDLDIITMLKVGTVFCMRLMASHSVHDEALTMELW